jgi:hypothetical protein
MGYCCQTDVLRQEKVRHITTYIKHVRQFRMILRNTLEAQTVLCDARYESARIKQNVL